MVQVARVTGCYTCRQLQDTITTRSPLSCTWHKWRSSKILILMYTASALMVSMSLEELEAIGQEFTATCKSNKSWLGTLRQLVVWQEVEGSIKRLVWYGCSLPQHVQRSTGPWETLPASRTPTPVIKRFTKTDQRLGWPGMPRICRRFCTTSLNENLSQRIQESCVVCHLECWQTNL